MDISNIFIFFGYIQYKYIHGCKGYIHIYPKKDIPFFGYIQKDIPFYGYSKDGYYRIYLNWIYPINIYPIRIYVKNIYPIRMYPKKMYPNIYPKSIYPI